MTEKILNDINLSDITTADIFTWLSSKDRLRVAYAEWLRREKFEYFIVLKFYDGHSISDEIAYKKLDCFLRQIDRKFIGRRLNNKGIRLDRMAFVEHGISGENTHFNLYISKPADVSDFDFRRHVIKFWERVSGYDDVFTQSSNNDDDVLFYSTKEMDFQCEKELLVAEHCYLSKLHNSDIQKLIYEGMKLKAAEKIQEKVSKARMERVKRRLKLASKNTSEQAMGSGITNIQVSVANELVRLAKPTQDAQT